MKILITGGTGYIGSHLAVDLLEQKHDVVLLDDFSNSCQSVGLALREITNRNADIVHCDVNDTPRLTEYLARYKPDWIVHLAGVKSVAESVNNPVKYFDINLGGSMSLVKAMRATGCKRVLFSSTATVYGNAESPFTEETKCLPVHNYGFSKLFAERVFEAESETGKIHSTVLRYFNPVGTHHSGKIGESPLSPPANLLPVLSEVAAGQREVLEIFGKDWPTDDGTCERDYIHIQDLVNAHIAALEADLEGHNVFNIGSGTVHSVLEVAEIFEVVNDLEIPRKISSRRLGDVASYYADSSKAQSVLNWQPQFDLAQACETEWNWKSRLWAK